MSKTTSRPRPSPQLLTSIRRLQGHPDYRQLCAYINDLADYNRELLVTTSPADTQIQQGIVRGMREIHETMTKDTP